LRVAQDAVEWGPQFVAHAGQEPCLCQACPFGRVSRLGEVPRQTIECDVGGFDRQPLLPFLFLLCGGALLAVGHVAE
jgi:hypothetical protein